MVKIFSIKQQFADKIFRNEKRVEYRRQNVKVQANELCLVYTSSPVKELSGYFVVKRKLRMPIGKLWQKTKVHAGISKSEFLKYFEGCIEGTAIVLKLVKQFITGLNLVEIKTILRNFTPPQSYCNLDSKLFNLFLNVFPQRTFVITK